MIITDAPTDLQILELAARFYRRPGGRVQAARAELGLSSTQYARRLLAIVERPSREVAEMHGPLIVRLSAQLAVYRARRAPLARGAKISA